jgi:hypothetical protein
MKRFEDIVTRAGEFGSSRSGSLIAMGKGGGVDFSFPWKIPRLLEPVFWDGGGEACAVEQRG